VTTADLDPDRVAHRCDVSDAAHVEALFAAAGPIDGLVDNAGLIVKRTPMADITPAAWDRVFAATGTFLCSQATCRPGRLVDGGAIVNIASETAFTGSHGFVHYVASKAAVVAMTRALANEVGRSRGIRVNCIAPASPTARAPGCWPTPRATTPGRRRWAGSPPR
jgi:NAD(P)-dependent dehydrogenase (short-subunit alcohol dehydrogenase family)